MTTCISDVSDAMNVFPEKFSNVDEAAHQEEKRTGHRVKLVQDPGHPAER